MSKFNTNGKFTEDSPNSSAPLTTITNEGEKNEKNGSGVSRANDNPNGIKPLRPHHDEGSSKSTLEKRDSNSSTESFGFDEKVMLKYAKKSANPSQPSSDPSSSGTSTKGEAPKSSHVEVEPQIPLPARFVVKYLGYREIGQLWGIKYTRRPVDEMVIEAKRLLSTSTSVVKSLPLLKLEVTENGIILGAMPQNTNPNFPQGKFAIETISYGVQDLVYTRVFAMIVVKAEGKNVRSSTVGTSDSLPFRCHAFVCDSRNTARRLTYALSNAFQMFSQRVSEGKAHMPGSKQRKFAIDLRPSVEDMDEDKTLDSEA